MNKTTLLGVLCLFVMGITQGQVVSENKSPLEKAQHYLKEKGEVVFTFQAQSKEQFKELARFLSISHKRVDQNELKVEAYANPQQFEKFQMYGIPFEVSVSENEFTADEYLTYGTSAWDDTWNAYPKYSEYVAKMQYWANTYPNLCKLQSIGTTPNGRTLYVLKISDNAQVDEAEPEFLYTSSMHGDEITGYPTMLRLIDYLLTGYATNSEISNIVNNTEIFICPLANPDGSYKTAGNDTMNSTGNTATRANSAGVDLNRNYPDPIDGLHPDGYAYQPETLAFMEFEKTRNFVLAANYHGGAEVVNFPWDTSTTPSTSNFSIHPHDNYFKFVSKEYAQLCQTADGNANYMDDVYNSGQFAGTTNGAAWYSVYGGRQDWNNFFNHNKEMTIEISATKFPSAANLPFYWQRNRQALLNYIKQANYGLKGTVKNSAGEAIDAKVYINGTDLMGSWVKTGPLGDYYKVMIEGTYNVIFEAPGYTSQTQNVTVSNNAATVLNVTMVPSTTIPTADEKTICEGQTAALTATGTGTIRWYADNTTTTVLATGTSYTTPALSANKSYFVERETPQTVGPTSISGGSSVNNTNSRNKYMIFSATAPSKLKTVTINTSAAGEILVELQNSTGTMLESKMVKLTVSGTQEIDLNFFVPAENNMRLVLRQISGFNIYAANSGITYPYSNGIVSITANSGTGTFLPFFNWKFQTFKSVRDEVIVTVKPNPAITTITPNTKVRGEAGFTLTVNGTNFVNGESIINWNGTNKTTTFVSSTQLTASISASDIAASGTVEVKVFNTCNNFSSAATNFTITAPTSTTWNGSSWSNGTPNSSLDAIINGNYASGTNGSFTTKSLTLNSGYTLTVNTGSSITISDAIVNNAGAANFIVESNANLIQTNNAVNNGLITVKRNSAPLYRFDYTLWSSPVSGQNLRNFSPATLTNRFYVYNPASGNNGNYEAIFPAQNEGTYTFAQAKGYLIRVPDNYVSYVNSSISGVSYNGVFVGVPYNGSFSFPLSNANNGFNLVGNPYPSAISISGLFSSNSNAIDGTVWFWRKRNGVAGSGYATTTGLGITSAQPEVAGMNPNGIISSGQGFFVKVKNGATQSSLNFNNSIRSAGTNGVFFRNGNINSDEPEKHRIWLNLSNETDIIGQTLLGYMAGATENVDYGIDGKYFNDSPIALTSYIDNSEYAIQGRSLPFSINDVVPLSFKTNVSGSYSISIDHLDGLFEANQDVFLKDNQTGQIHNLKIAAYNFVTESGNFTNRFEIVYRAALGMETPTINSNSIVVYKKNEMLYIDAGNYMMEKIEIYDVSGRLIYSKSEVDDTKTVISNLSVANQVLLVKIVTSENGTATKKMVY
ncbi:MAG: hypothetical protein BGO88_16960 [Flavobacterium sp. 38-13]|uniref:M14 family zinc carboxypeptidase n=1 Tax=Flavobacterium sp. 38-13 TaxID=1896168 RepID=UPI000961F450|nr:M14 family zinc carboxypeptidase [Flavobacterium sp. 38-13]OJX52242.1 MAG: hypothetical protein BGO88_16960 [Flavobacterium sp. 38-13]